MDEVYTYEDSRDGLSAQLKFYQGKSNISPSSTLFCPHPPVLPLSKTRKGPPDYPFDLWHPVDPDDLLSCKIFFSPNCSTLRPLPDIHGLSHQCFTRWPCLLSSDVSWNDEPFFIHEVLKNFETSLPFFYRSCLCVTLLFQLQFHPIYCLLPDTLVLSAKRKSPEASSLILFHLERADVSLHPSVAALRRF